jgi:hypothetical protein
MKVKAIRFEEVYNFQIQEHWRGGGTPVNKIRNLGVS